MSPVPTPQHRVAVAVREFARLDGCSPKRVRNGRDSGHLECDATGQPYADQAKGAWRQRNRRGEETPIGRTGDMAGIPASVPGDDEDNLDEPMFAGLPSQREAIDAMNQAAVAADYTAEALLPLLPPAKVRVVVDTIYRRLVAGSVELLDRRHQPPPGFAKWGDHPGFKGPSLHEEDWNGMLKRAQVTA